MNTLRTTTATLIIIGATAIAYATPWIIGWAMGVI